MFLFGKKKENSKSALELLVEELNGKKIDYRLINKTFFMAVDEAVRNAKSFEDVDVNRNKIYFAIMDSEHGVDWFTESCVQYFRSLKELEEIDGEKDKLDAYLGAYWFYVRYEKDKFTALMVMMEKDIPPLVRRYYEKQFNIDIYNGTVYDKELEAKNAFKEHFYRASFAYNQGKGDLDLSMREWRYFLNDLAHTIEDRPRVIYDFAKEICEHQKLFMFVAYAMKAENFDKMHNAANHAQGTVLNTVLNKINNAVYATNEDYGIFLKRYYA